MDTLHGSDSSSSKTQPTEDSLKKMQCAICQQKTTKTCSGCKSVSYCCIDHQKLDWKNHKKVCLPFSIEKTENMGMGWFATRDLKAGTLLLEEIPAIEAPDWFSSSPPTDDDNKKCLVGGLKMDSLRTCSTCSWPVCTDVCERNPLHSDNECREFVLRKLKYPPPPDWPIGLLTMCMRANVIKARNPRKFEELMSLQDCYENPSSNKKLQKLDLPAGMFEVLSGPNCLDLEEFRKLLRICKLNGNKGVCPPSGINGPQDFNIGVYLKLSRLNHSCLPNCVVTFGPHPFPRCHIRTTVPISAGEQLTMNYHAGSWRCFGSTTYRRLIQIIDFICQCQRCRDPTEFGTFLTGVKCFSCSVPLDVVSESDGYLVPADPVGEISADQEYECHRCHLKCTYSDIWDHYPTTLTDGLKEFQEKIRLLTLVETIDHKALDNLLTKYEEDSVVNYALHKNHWLVQVAMRKLIIVQMNNLEKMTEEELDRLVRRLEYFVLLGDQLYPGVMFQPIFEDLMKLNKAAAFLLGRFGFRMSREKRFNLVRICNNAENDQLEFLVFMQEVDSEEETSEIAMSLKRKTREEKELAQSINKLSLY